MIKHIEVDKRMSQVVIHGNTVYLAGQVAFDKPGTSVAEQTRNILERIDRYLLRAGTGKSKILTATVWLANIADFDEMNSVWDSWVVPANAPARACVEAKLAAPQFTVEIMVTAALK